MRARRLNAAFTLLEIMLAVSILALVIGAVYGTWSAALQGWRHGTTATEQFQRQRVVTEALAELTRSAVFFVGQPELYEVRSATESGLGSSVSFVTASDVLLPPAEQLLAGMRRVTLAIQRDDRGLPYLAIANEPALIDTQRPPPPSWHVLSSDVVGFQVRYRNPQDGTWSDRWEDPTLLPGALEFTVAFRGDDPRAKPLVMTRAIDFPTAGFVLDARGQTQSQHNTTNHVTRQDINLSEADTSGGDR